MHHVRSLDAVPADLKGACLTIGNFDGVHLGHRALLRRVINHAKARNAPSVVVTFEPHPLAVLAPDKAPPRLTSSADRAALCHDAGVDGVLEIPFSRELSGTSPVGFLDMILKDALQASVVTVGWNFRFGKRAAGTTETLQDYGNQHGIEADIVSPIQTDNDPVSSSRVRKALQAGDVAVAASLLNRCHSISGPVTAGERRGRTLGFPTLNLDPRSMAVPQNGVYVTVVDVKGQRYPAVTNVGVRPTFCGHEAEPRVLIESHLLNGSGDFYDANHRVHFIARVRDERKFASGDELAAAIRQDQAVAREYHLAHQSPRLWPEEAAEKVLS